MPLYPSLEDMKVDQIVQAQHQAHQQHQQQQQGSIPAYPGQPTPYPVQPGAPAAGGAYPVAQASAPASVHNDGVPVAQGVPVGVPIGTAPPEYGVPAVAGGAVPSAPLYPSLDEYMGLSMTTISQNTGPQMSTAVVVPQGGQVAMRPGASQQQMVAPISAGDLGIKRAEVRQGIREVTLCKDGNGKMGLRVRAISKGVFVALVHRGSPAALAGMRFGDQILQVNGENVAGWSNDKTMKFLKNCRPEKIVMALRDRPFERTVTMQKDSTGHVGFTYKHGKVTALIKDSSACRNGLLIDQQLIEVNGQNVVGLKDNDLGDIFSQSPRTVTVTLMPTFLYDHMVKCMGSSLIKNSMDHSIPEV